MPEPPNSDEPKPASDVTGAAGLVDAVAKLARPSLESIGLLFGVQLGNIRKVFDGYSGAVTALQRLQTGGAAKDSPLDLNRIKTDSDVARRSIIEAKTARESYQMAGISAS